MKTVKDLIFKNFEETYVEVGFNCDDEYIERDDELMYLGVDDISTSLSKDEIIEFRNKLNEMIAFKEKVDSINN